MDSFRAQFERDLKEKVQQRMTGKFSEEQILTRAFRYFDLDDNQTVSYQEWVKAIEKLGIIFQNLQMGHDLFKFYDKDGNGKLNYKEFTSALYTAPAASAAPAPAPQQSDRQIQEGERVVENLRRALAERGGRGIIGLGRQFKIMDDNNSKTLDQFEFQKAIHDFKVAITKRDTEVLFNYIDRNRSGAIDYDEFLRAVRGPMNDFRKAIVSKAYDRLDADESGQIDINDIRGVYDARNHPAVKKGEKTEDEILGEFLETFEMHHNIVGRPDHIVTREEFEEYYNNISCSIDNDEYFELMMTNTWKLNEPRAKPATEEAKHPPQEEEFKGPPQSPEALLESFRNALRGRGARGIIGISRQFKIMDDDGSRNLSLAEFQKACHDFRVPVPPAQITELFGIIDRDSSGSVDYDELLRGIRGPLNDFRKAFVHKAFGKMDKDGNGVLEMADITGVYDAKGHPDVKNGKKTEEEVLGEFLETFETHHNIKNPSAKDRRITLEEFEEYYANISASIDEDAYFELMMNNAWKLVEQPAQRADFSYGRNRNYERSQAPFGTVDTPTDWSTSNRGATRGRQPEVMVGDLRKKLAARGGAGGFIGLARQFKIMDDDDSKSLNFDEFTKAIKDFRVEVHPQDVRGLFDFMDADKNGSIQYEEFVHKLRGELNNFRKDLVTRAFGIMDKNGNGVVELDDVRGVYNASNHPDVRSGKKTEDEILCEFLDTFEVHHAVFKEDTRDHSVTLDEFLEYYGHVSASVDDDRYFELMMNKAWFDKPVSQPGWKGDFTEPERKLK